MSKVSEADEVPEKIEKSKLRFQNIVWPEIQHWFGGGRLVPGEAVNEEVAELLDTECGVDFYAVVKDTGIITIASRCQKRGYYETTTIRFDTGTNYDTELQKRLRQLDAGLLSPQFTIQSYVTLDGTVDAHGRQVYGTLQNAAACLTGPLIRHIDESERGDVPDDLNQGPKDGGYYVKRNPVDGNLFVAVPWSVLDTVCDLRVRYRGETSLGAPVGKRPLGRPWWRVAVRGDTQ